MRDVGLEGRSSLYVTLHVLVSIKGGSQVEILDVEAHVLHAFGAEDTVPHQFRCGEVSCSCREFARVVYEVTERRQSFLDDSHYDNCLAK